MADTFFKIIASSSQGNCAFLKANDTKILVDAGVSPRRIKNALHEINLTLEEIDAIFITHEHSDHCKALLTLPDIENLTVFASETTYETIAYRYEKTQRLKWKVFSAGQTFAFKNIKVSTCAMPHDASECVAYKFDFNQKSIAFITDLGKPTISAKELAKSANVLVLESNYCPVMLQNSNRSAHLKQRISGSHGHLSNADAISILMELDPDLVEQVYLGHISRECNTVEHIREIIQVLPPKLLSKIEVVNPFDANCAPFAR